MERERKEIRTGDSEGEREEIDKNRRYRRRVRECERETKKI